MGNHNGTQVLWSALNSDTAQKGRTWPQAPFTFHRALGEHVPILAAHRVAKGIMTQRGLQSYDPQGRQMDTHGLGFIKLRALLSQEIWIPSAHCGGQDLARTNNAELMIIDGRLVRRKQPTIVRLWPPMIWNMRVGKHK